ncbi:hypothetical protein VTN96DRAFT_5474 [Rasamsonia emersonii]
MMPEPSVGPYWYHHEGAHSNGGDILGVPGPSYAHHNPVSPHRSYTPSYFPSNPPANGYSAPSYPHSPSYHPMHGYMSYQPRYHAPHEHAMPGPVPYSGPPSYHSSFPAYGPPPSSWSPGPHMPYHENGRYENRGAEPSTFPPANYGLNISPQTIHGSRRPSSEHGGKNHSVDVPKRNQPEDESDDESELSDTSSSETEAAETSSGDNTGEDDAGGKVAAEPAAVVPETVPDAIVCVDANPAEAEAQAEAQSNVAADVSAKADDNARADAVANVVANTNVDVDATAGIDTDANATANADETDSPFHIRLALCSFLEVLPLTEHLLRSFEGEQFTDAQIVLTSMENMFYPITFRVHQVLMAQSPVLASILKRKAAFEQKNAINVISGRKFCLARAFETALQNLYGLPLVDGPRLKQLTMKALGWEGCPVEIDSIKNKGATIDFAICYGVSGAFLHNREILETGFKLVIELIEWDTLQLALQFGLFAADFLVSYDSNASSERPPQRNNNNTNRRGKKANTAPDVKAPPIHDNLNKEVLEVWAPKVVSAALQFMIRSLPTVFHFDRLAQATSMPDRIPADLRTVPGSILANPKLASVKFGSMGSASEQKPSRECTLASAVFLSLPFERLREAFGIMRQRRVLGLDLVRAILQEREERRLRALQAYAKKNPKIRNEGDYPAELKELGYEEYVVRRESQVREGDKLRDVVIFHDFSLEREWKGYGWTVAATAGEDRADRLVRKKST